MHDVMHCIWFAAGAALGAAVQEPLGARHSPDTSRPRSWQPRLRDGELHGAHGMAHGMAHGIAHGMVGGISRSDSVADCICAVLHHTLDPMLDPLTLLACSVTYLLRPRCAPFRPGRGHCLRRMRRSTRLQPIHRAPQSWPRLRHGGPARVRQAAARRPRRRRPRPPERGRRRGTRRTRSRARRTGTLWTNVLMCCSRHVPATMCGAAHGVAHGAALDGLLHPPPSPPSATSSVPPSRFPPPRLPHPPHPPRLPPRPWQARDQSGQPLLCKKDVQQQAVAEWKDADFRPEQKRELGEQQKRSVSSTLASWAAAGLTTYGLRRPRTCARRASRL